MHKKWGYVWWWVWCWIVSGLVVIMLGDKYEDFLFNIWSSARSSTRLRKEGTCLLKGKFVYINWGRSVCFLYPSNLVLKVPMITSQVFAFGLKAWQWMFIAIFLIQLEFFRTYVLPPSLSPSLPLSTISHSNRHRCAWSNKLQVGQELSYNLSL